MTLPSGPGGNRLADALGPVPHLLRDLVHERIGVYFDEPRFDTMLEKLAPRVALHQCASFLDYYYILKYEEKGPEEWRRVMDAFSVQETYFWREPDQIQVLVDRIIPAWFRERQTPLRIWSAACASGEEPYSLALAVREAGWEGHPITIIGSDASEAALDRARRAVYRERSFRTLPPRLRERCFTPAGEQLQLDPRIRSMVTLRWANLIEPASYADLAPVHVIFCRNVFIYFSPQAITRTVGGFARLLGEDGFLFVGASESLLKLTRDFELAELGGAFVYRPTAAEARA